MGTVDMDTVFLALDDGLVYLPKAPMPHNEAIERVVERAFDNLDRRFTADGSEMTQEQYDAKAKRIGQWAEMQYGLLSGRKPS